MELPVVEAFVGSLVGVLTSARTYWTALFVFSAGFPASGSDGRDVVVDEFVDSVQSFKHPVTVMVRISDDIGFCESVGLVGGVCAKAGTPAMARPRPKAIHVRFMTLLLGDAMPSALHQSVVQELRHDCRIE